MDDGRGDGTERARLRAASHYLDRGVRYLIEVDGQAQATRLSGLDSVSTGVGPGEHVVRVSVGHRRYFEALVHVAPGETLRYRAVPGPVLGRGALFRQPRLTEAGSGRAVPGAVGKRGERIADLPPRHLPERS
jgi:hypothetical protein